MIIQEYRHTKTHADCNHITYKLKMTYLYFQLANSAPKLTQRNNISQPALTEYDSRRRDSIPEEAEEDRLATAGKPAKPKTEIRPPPPSYDEAVSEHRKSWHSDDSTPT